MSLIFNTFLIRHLQICVPSNLIRCKSDLFADGPLCISVQKISAPIDFKEDFGFDRQYPGITEKQNTAQVACPVACGLCALAQTPAPPPPLVSRGLEARRL